MFQLKLVVAVSAVLFATAFASQDGLSFITLGDWGGAALEEPSKPVSTPLHNTPREPLFVAYSRVYARGASPHPRSVNLNFGRQLRFGKRAVGPPPAPEPSSMLCC